MKRPTKNLVKVVVSLAMGLTSGAPAAFAAASCKSVQDECKKEAHAKKLDNDTKAGVVSTGEDNPHKQAGALAAVAADSCEGFQAVAEKCRNLKSKCDDLCKSADGKLAKTCKDNLENEALGALGTAAASCHAAPEAQNVANNTGGAPPSEQPASTGGGGGSGLGGMVIPGLVGALAGGLIGYMRGKKQGKKDKDKDKDDTAAAVDPNAALQANGTVDCSKADAYQYRDCNDYLSGVCLAEINAGTYASDPKCENFGNRFCSFTPGTPTVPVTPVVNLGDGGGNMGVATTSASPPLGATGEGAGTQVCQSVLAFNFCRAGGRDQCPSCLQLAKNQSAACTTNPALCLAQNSQAQIETAKATCPTDPAFSNPSYASGGGAVAAQMAGSGASLPAVVLPQSVGAGGGGSAASASAAVPSTGLSVASVASVGGGGSASREGATTGPGSATGSGSGGGGSTGGRSDVASGVGGSYKPANAGRGPASDVQGQFGPSLFAMGTQVYRSRCQAGKLNNCP